MVLKPPEGNAETPPTPPMYFPGVAVVCRAVSLMEGLQREESKCTQAVLMKCVL